jgi:hypothetical protein
MKSALDSLIEELEAGEGQASKAFQPMQAEQCDWPPPLPVREREAQGRANLAACSSPHCAGCYDVGDGKRIHPPKCSPEWLAWLERWKPPGTVQ